MGLGLLLALNMTWQQKIEIRLCHLQADGIVRRYNRAGKKAKQICEEMLTANELTYDEYDFEECYEYLIRCPNK